MKTLTVYINFGEEVTLEFDERERSFNSYVPLLVTGVGNQDILTVRKWLNSHIDVPLTALDCPDHRDEGIDGLLADVEMSLNENGTSYKMFTWRDYEEAGTDEDETSIDADGYGLVIVWEE